MDSGGWGGGGEGEEEEGEGLQQHWRDWQHPEPDIKRSGLWGQEAQWPGAQGTGLKRGGPYWRGRSPGHRLESAGVPGNQQVIYLRFTVSKTNVKNKQTAWCSISLLHKWFVSFSPVHLLTSHSSYAPRDCVSPECVLNLKPSTGPC